MERIYEKYEKESTTSKTFKKGQIIVNKHNEMAKQSQITKDFKQLMLYLDEIFKEGKNITHGAIYDYIVSKYKNKLFVKNNGNK